MQVKIVLHFAQHQTFRDGFHAILYILLEESFGTIENYQHYITFETVLFYIEFNLRFMLVLSL